MSKQAKKDAHELALDEPQTIEATATETPATPEIETPPETPVAPDLDESIDNLKKQVEAANRAREDAERQAREERVRAQQAQIDAQRAQTRAEDTDIHLVKQALTTIKDRMAQTKAALAEAHSVGDYTKVADLQEAMAVSAVQLRELENGLSAMERQKAAPKPEPQRPVGDLVDALIPQVSARSQRWLDAHRAHLKDEKAINRMFRAHGDAIDDGIEADSDEYFRFVENRLGINKPAPNREEREDTGEPLSEASKAVQRDVPPPSAPASRGSSRPGTVRLSAEEREMAEMMGISPEAYAKNREALKSEGKIH